MIIALWVDTKISMFSGMRTDYSEFIETTPPFNSKCFKEGKEGINEANMIKSRQLLSRSDRNRLCVVRFFSSFCACLKIFIIKRFSKR